MSVKARSVHSANLIISYVIARLLILETNYTTSFSLNRQRNCSRQLDRDEALIPSHAQHYGRTNAKAHCGGT